MGGPAPRCTCLEDPARASPRLGPRPASSPTNTIKFPQLRAPSRQNCWLWAPGRTRCRCTPSLSSRCWRRTLPWQMSFHAGERHVHTRAGVGLPSMPPKCRVHDQPGTPLSSPAPCPPTQNKPPTCPTQRGDVRVWPDGLRLLRPGRRQPRQLQVRGGEGPAVGCAGASLGSQASARGRAAARVGTHPCFHLASHCRLQDGRLADKKKLALGSVTIRLQIVECAEGGGGVLGE